MNPCKRMTVTAIGIKDNKVYTATNGNENECTNVKGKCGCIHAEINLLNKVIPDVLIVSHSPCINCAKEIIKHNVKIVLFKEEYRLKDGLKLLKSHGVTVMKY